MVFVVQFDSLIYDDEFAIGAPLEIATGAGGTTADESLQADESSQMGDVDITMESVGRSNMDEIQYFRPLKRRVVDLTPSTLSTTSGISGQLSLMEIERRIQILNHVKAILSSLQNLNLT